MTCPIHSVSYRARPKAHDFEKSAIKNMLVMNVIEPVPTECALPVTFAPKERRTFTFLYRLQNVKRRDSSRLVSIIEDRRIHWLPLRCTGFFNPGRELRLLADWRGWTWQGKNCVDFSSRILSIQMHVIWSKSRLCHIPTCDGHHIFLWKWRFEPFYLHNIVIFSRTSQKLINHTWIAMSLLKGADITWTLNKCTLFTTKIDYLGQAIRPCRLRVANCTIEAKDDFKMLTTQTELSSFSGLYSVFRKFIPNFTRNTSTLAARQCNL